MSIYRFSQYTHQPWSRPEYVWDNDVEYMLDMFQEQWSWGDSECNIEITTINKTTTISVPEVELFYQEMEALGISMFFDECILEDPQMKPRIDEVWLKFRMRMHKYSNTKLVVPLYGCNKCGMVYDCIRECCDKLIVQTTS